MDIPKLKALAEAATPSPWPEVEYENDTGPGDEGFWEWYEIPGIAKFDNKANAAYIAAIDPQTLLAILAGYQEAVEALARAQDEVTSDILYDVDNALARAADLGLVPRKGE